MEVVQDHVGLKVLIAAFTMARHARERKNMMLHQHQALFIEETFESASHSAADRTRWPAAIATMQRLT